MAFCLSHECASAAKINLAANSTEFYQCKSDERYILGEIFTEKRTVFPP
jgi:hypothetical protein